LLLNVRECIVPSSRLTVTCSPIMYTEFATRKAPRPAFQIDRLGMCSRCS
jgi:hypothetical protein